MEDKKIDILEAGIEIFNSKGYKDTYVSDITKKAGIGVGTFYNYYSSKEKLFIEIFIKENKELKRSIMEAIDLDGEPVEEIKKFLALNLSGTNANPILREWYNKELISKLEKEFYQQGGMESIYDMLNEGTIDLIKVWKEKGKLRKDFTDDYIMAIFKSIPYIDLHKEDIGMKYFPQLMDTITEFIMNGLKTE